MDSDGGGDSQLTARGGEMMISRGSSKRLAPFSSVASTTMSVKSPVTKGTP